MWWIWCTALAGDPALLESGDLVFQNSRSAQADAIRVLTNSPWSHVGVVVERDGKRFVFEAVQPVKLTPWDTWVARDDGTFGARRLPGLTETDTVALETAGRPMLGRDYDLAFAWDDERLYCSEAVHKVFLAIGVTLGERQKVSDFALDAAAEKRRKARGIALDQEVISPASIYDDPDLVPVF